MAETPYRIVSNETLGRHLVAARDLKKGEIILQEYPLAAGPERGSVILCPVCNMPPTDSQYQCQNCNWPICGPDCSQHDTDECHLFQAMKELDHQHYKSEAFTNVLMLLRLLLLKSKDEIKWKHILDMETNWEAWSKSELYLQAENTSSVLRKLFPEFCDKYTGKEIHHVQAALDINAYEVRMPEVNIQAMYSFARLVEHNCCPNTFRTMNTSQLLTLYAAQDILQGSNITTSYCDVLWSTAQRQEYLKWSKFFACSCQRCLDPSELSSELSSLLCSQCGGPMRPILHDDELCPDQLSEPTSFKCSGCCNTIEHSEGTSGGGTVAKNELESLDDNLQDLQDSKIREYENWLVRWTKLDLPGLEQQQELDSEVKLFPNHSLVIDCCHTLFLLYSRDEGSSVEKLERKIKLGTLLLDSTKPLSSGIPKFRGTVTYELAVTKISLFMSQLDNQDKSDAYLTSNRKIAEEAIKHLKASLELLQYEPVDQPEGSLAVTGVKQLEEFETFLTSITTTPELK